jgi:transposase
MFLESPIYYTIPEATAQAAHAAFPKGHMYLCLRDELGPIYANPDFAHLFPTHGQPALAPARLALVTVMQMVDGLSDVEAADAVRDRLSWKYALALDLDDPGFDASVLCDFRTRLLAGGAEYVLLDALLTRLVDHGLLKARGRQRSDSTQVLASIRTLTRLMVVGETLRAALNAIARVAPAWVQALSPPAWFARYRRRVEEERLPGAKPERAALAATIGADGVHVLQAVYGPTAPADLAALPAVEILRQVWLQQYYAPDANGQSRWRGAEDTPPSAQLIHSPYDLEARDCTKHDRHWVGYKTHITATGDADRPHLITQVETTLATVPDGKAPDLIHTALAAKALLPSDHLLDRG